METYEDGYRNGRKSGMIDKLRGSRSIIGWCAAVSPHPYTLGYQAGYRAGWTEDKTRIEREIAAVGVKG